MAQGLKLGLGLPLWLGYVVSTLHGDPAGDLRHEGAQQAPGVDDAGLAAADGRAAALPGRHRPRHRRTASSPTPAPTASGGIDAASVLLGAGVCLSLIAQIGEQVDYLRFMPPKTDANRRSWWTAVIMAGPGWVDPRRAQAGHRRLPRRLRHRPGRRGRGHRADPAVHRRLRRPMMPSWLVVPLAVVTRRDQPDQDQRDQRLLRFAGLDELLHPGHQALPGPDGLRPRQPRPSRWP